MTHDIVILRDKDFQDFVTMSTEVIARIAINNETGTVGEGPWYEEYLPSDTILYALVLASNPFLPEEKKIGICNNAEGVMTFFEQGLNIAENFMQIGGNATIGKGLVRTHLLNGKGGQNHG